ncbi:MAG: HNH endonuclease [Actinobacteria bacterium]|nr:HNH endonuclease [Actinomycetota bacterium]
MGIATAEQAAPASTGAEILEHSREAEAAEARLCVDYAAFEASGEWALDRSYNAAVWIAGRTRLKKKVVTRRLWMGRSVRHMPAVAQAWLAGEISTEAVSALIRARNERTAEAFARDEQMLVGFARKHRFDVFYRAVQHWIAHADPDGAERTDDERHAARALDFDLSLDGMGLGRFTLDPVGAAIFGGELSRQERQLYDQDRAKVGAWGDPNGLRSPAQRRADALVEMAIRSATAPSDGRRPRPLFTALVDYPSLAGRVCELANGTVVAPGTLARWLTEADIERVVFGPDGRPLDVGKRRRLFTGAKRRAIEVRDRECQVTADCDRPAIQCQVDHIEPYGAGGLTTLDNGRLACKFHNLDRQRRCEDRGPPQPDS